MAIACQSESHIQSPTARLKIAMTPEMSPQDGGISESIRLPHIRCQVGRGHIWTMKEDVERVQVAVGERLAKGRGSLLVSLSGALCANGSERILTSTIRTPAHRGEYVARPSRRQHFDIHRRCLCCRLSGPSSQISHPQAIHSHPIPSPLLNPLSLIALDSKVRQAIRAEPIHFRAR